MPLVDGGFEHTTSTGEEGVPTKFGEWGGDFATICRQEQGVSPAEGQAMLKLLRGDNRKSPTETKSFVAEMWQAIDLNEQSIVNSERPVIVELSGRFNAGVDVSDERVAFGIAVLAFTGDVTDLPELWRDRNDLALARSDKEELVDSQPETWQTLTSRVNIPHDANLLLVQLRITRKGPGPRVEDFGQHFVDDVSLKIVEAGTLAGNN
jgi:hypothetical protein